MGEPGGKGHACLTGNEAGDQLEAYMASEKKQKISSFSFFYTLQAKQITNFN